MCVGSTWFYFIFKNYKFDFASCYCYSFSPRIVACDAKESFLCRKFELKCRTSRLRFPVRTVKLLIPCLCWSVS